MGSPAYIQKKTLAEARKRAYCDVDAAAKAAGVSVERYVSWESDGEFYPTMRQARLLAGKFHRAVSFFYLVDPPEEIEPIAELRRLPGFGDKPPSPGLAWQIQLASERRDFALSLLKELGDEAETDYPTLKLTDDPSEAAGNVRDWLGVTLDQQFATKDLREALNLWRDALEQRHVLVFQVPSIKRSEMEGFAISKRPMPVVAYNSKVTGARRIFTLVHELIHVLLNDSVLHSTSVLLVPQNATVEHFCNKLAAELLVPSDSLLSQAIVRSYGPDGFWVERDVEAGARLFRVSPSVMVRRLRALGRIADEPYQNLKDVFDSRRPVSRESGGGNPYANRRVWTGKLLSSLAFRGFYDNLLNAHDLSSLFNLRPEKLGGMEKTVYGRKIRFD